jgi:hypothetical protein
VRCHQPTSSDGVTGDAASSLLNAGILRRPLAIVGTVQAGDPFVAVNAVRLQAIAWSLAALQIIGLGRATGSRTGLGMRSTSRRDR